MSPPPIQAAIEALVSVFDELEIPYFIGGSVASSVHGSPRSTLDADLVASLSREQVDALADRLSSAFYADREMIDDAVERRASFNVIHLETVMKVDVFVLGSTPYDQTAFERARSLPLVGPGGRHYRLSSAEDVILHKLHWYRAGAEVSERQWGDVLGVLRVQGDALDHRYLERWAETLEVQDLLLKALQEAGREE